MEHELSEKINVLFLCTGNACRSQMAEAWARHFHPDKFNAFSAGVAPSFVFPETIAVMEEAGVNMSHARSKHADEFLDKEIDVVITVCDYAKEVCPVFPEKVRTFHRGFDDPPSLIYPSPGEDGLAQYRRVRDEIRDFVKGLPEALEAISEGEN